MGILSARLKFRMSIKCIPDFLILFIKKVANSSTNSLLLVEESGGLGVLLPVIVMLRLNSFLVFSPASMICKESVCVFALLIIAMYHFLSTLRAVH